ncbi:tRNA lysidine(34) synthetase TilS [Candidatus Microgenomates bacterium]|nr:tRNA lysidine(34) synthetase TilS [Candidatus Microgenomates bacterium]
MGKTLAKKVMFPPPGKYIVAVSGGVDSVVLLDLLATHGRYDLCVAHFDHGMRTDSKLDREFVAALAKQYGLRFAYAEGKLGLKATEEQARQARYRYLQQLAQELQARIVTAHHQDDVLETAIFNAGRGADRLGLTPLHLNQQVIRPLLKLSKSELVDYAKKQQLKWQEDPTNADVTIARNFIRQRALPQVDRTTLAERIEQLAQLNQNLNRRWEDWLSRHTDITDDSMIWRRSDLVSLRPDELADLLRYSLRRLNTNLEAAQVNRLAHFCIAAQPGKQLALGGNLEAKCIGSTIRLAKS